MKNLKSLEVLELDKFETQQINGGMPIIAWVGLSLMLESAIRGAAAGIHDAANR